MGEKNYQNQRHDHLFQNRRHNKKEKLFGLIEYYDSMKSSLLSLIPDFDFSFRTTTKQSLQTN